MVAVPEMRIVMTTFGNIGTFFTSLKMRIATTECTRYRVGLHRRKNINFELRFVQGVLQRFFVPRCGTSLSLRASAWHSARVVSRDFLVHTSIYERVAEFRTNTAYHEMC